MKTSDKSPQEKFLAATKKFHKAMVNYFEAQGTLIATEKAVEKFGKELTSYIKESKGG